MAPSFLLQDSATFLADFGYLISIQPNIPRCSCAPQRPHIFSLIHSQKLSTHWALPLNDTIFSQRPRPRQNWHDWTKWPKVSTQHGCHSIFLLQLPNIW